MKQTIAIIFIVLQGILFGETVDIQKLYQQFALSGKMDYAVFEEAYLGYLMIPEKNPDVLGIVDYTRPSNEKRFFLLDMEHQKVLNQTYVSHAKNSGLEEAVHFSNRPNSLQNSLGFYLTKDTYRGEYGYSLVLSGLEEEFNSNAEKRRIVMHGGEFAEEEYLKTYGFLGRSWGCPVLPRAEAISVIDKLKHGHVLFIAGKDEEYKRKSKFIMR